MRRALRGLGHRLDQRRHVADLLHRPHLLHQLLRPRRTEHRSYEIQELRLQPGVVERHDARAERFVGLTGEAAARGRDRHPRRSQLRIEPVDVGRHRHRELAGDRGEGRIASHLLGEVLDLDGAESHRESDQVGEAELRAGEIIPAGLGVLGGDAIGGDVDALHLLGRDALIVEQADQRLDRGLDVAAARIGLDSGPNLNWLVKDKDIAPHIPVIDKSKREDGTFSREDFRFDKERNVYICPAKKTLTTTGTVIDDGETLRYLASTSDCRGCPLKARCCPKTPFRRIPRSIYEEARDVARALAKTEAFEQSRRERKRVEMLFAHLKRILKLGRLRLRGPRGAQDEFTLAAIAQNLRRLAKLIVRPPPKVATCGA